MVRGKGLIIIITRKSRLAFEYFVLILNTINMINMASKFSNTGFCYTHYVPRTTLCSSLRTVEEE